MTLAVAVEHGFPGFGLHVGFSAPSSGVTVLFGPSGCGKSTVLAVIAGLLRPRHGTVALNGAVLLNTGAGVDVPAEQRRCGMVFQDARLFPHLSVEANLRFGLRRAPRDAAGPALQEITDLLGLAPLLRRRPAGLSGGERQRVALGRALLSRPRLLLMDEPLAALDDTRKSEILPFLAKLRDVLTIPMLYVTHALDEVDRLADTLVLMDAGKVVAAGNLPALSVRPDLPLATRRDAGAVLPCIVLDHDPARGLTRLGFAGGRLFVPLNGLAIGTPVRLRLQARDVSVGIGKPGGLSIQNILPAQVVALTALPGGHEAHLTLQIGPSRILARVTRDAVERLGLTPGRAVWALVKSVAFDGQAP